MAIEAQKVQDVTQEVVHWTTDADYTGGTVVQVPDGRAGVIVTDVTSGRVAAAAVSGIYKVQKTTSMIMLNGSQLYWDHSANKAHLLYVNDRDFLLGTAVTEDIAGTGTAATINVNLNVRPVYTVSFGNGFSTVKIQTAGFPNACGAGREGFNAQLDATAEAQKADALSYEAVSVVGLANSIVDMLLAVTSNGNANVLDMNFGLANATHATDADSITEHMFVHLDGNDLNINLQSKDGTTTVAATDTTVDYVLSTPFLVQYDCRDLANIKAYVNGVRVLSGSTFKLNAAAGPMKLLAHVEKSANATIGNATFCRGGIRTSQDI